MALGSKKAVGNRSPYPCKNPLNLSKRAFHCRNSVFQHYISLCSILIVLRVNPTGNYYQNFLVTGLFSALQRKNLALRCLHFASRHINWIFLRFISHFFTVILHFFLSLCHCEGCNHHFFASPCCYKILNCCFLISLLNF